MVRRLTRVLPKASVISSSSASTGGSRPTIQSTAAIHASHEIVRSTSRTSAEAGNTARSTRANRRMTASERNTDTAMRSTSTGWKSSTHAPRKVGAAPAPAAGTAGRRRCARRTRSNPSAGRARTSGTPPRPAPRRPTSTASFDPAALRASICAEALGEVAEIHQSGSEIGQHAHVRFDAARQRVEVVAAFQHRHDAPLGMPPRDVARCAR